MWFRSIFDSGLSRSARPQGQRKEGGIGDIAIFLFPNPLRVDLQSQEPLPPFSEFLDLQEIEAKEMFELAAERPAAQFAKEKKKYQETLEYLASWREHKATGRAKITGSLYAGWAPLPWNNVWP